MCHNAKALFYTGLALFKLDFRGRNLTREWGVSLVCLSVRHHAPQQTILPITVKSNIEICSEDHFVCPPPTLTSSPKTLIV